MSFKLPQGWAWAMLGEVAEIQLGKMLDKKNTVGNLHPYLANVSVRWGSFDLGNLKQMPFSHSEVEKFALKLGDIIMCEGGVPGRCAVWREEADNIKYQKALHRIRLYETSPEFVRYYFEAIHDTMFFTARFSGSTIHHLPRETLIQVPIPLPPIAEQKRIVAKIEELFAIDDSLGEAADNLEGVAKRLDKKILNLAIRGKLVPQDPNDEPASELVKRIAASHKSPCKNQRVPIDPPFDLPHGWVWTRIGDVFSMKAGKHVSAEDIHSYSAQFQYPCYGGNGIRGYVADYSHEGNHAVVGRQGALCGNLNYATDKFYATEHAVVVTTYCDVSARFTYWFLMALDLNRYATATAQPGLSVKEVEKVSFPLPPLAEQKRIVAKIEELRAVIKSLTT